MRNKTSIFKRSLAALLCLVMILGMVPAMDLVPEAQAAEAVSADHITMPITIRDFAADGMLFEYNETGEYGLEYKDGEEGSIPVWYNKTYTQTGNNYYYAYVWDTSFATTMSDEFNEWWHVIFINSDGTVNSVTNGLEAKNVSIPDGGKVIFAYGEANNYTYLSGITESNKANYVFDTVDVYSSGETGYLINVTKYKAVYDQKNTKGFSLMYTDSTDFNNNIDLWDDVGALIGSLIAYNIPSVGQSGTLQETGDVYDGLYKGTDSYGYPHYYPYQPYGLWDKSSNGYGNQRVYGATIRTNLTDRYLDDEGKPMYTPSTVLYLAEYMQGVMAVPEQNADGSYNTYFVTGTAVADGQTLAARIRAQLAANGNELGDPYTSSDKFYGTGEFEDQGKQLRTWADIETWCDAAFFLLHNTWRDSGTDDDGTDGYGMPIDNYHSLHLVATEVDGKTTYVFNSAYTDAVYNPETGEIYNTQVTKIEQAYTNDDEPATADGNIQPVDRFDPLGVHGTGSYLGYNKTYGPSPDTYGDMIEDSDANWADYYDTTNYHLSLEGHAYFVYHEDADQYFTFTGDDDVYLYINNQRVLDIGGGHSIAKVGIRLNDVAEAIGLVDGETYPFDFFYMERHGTAANFGIETNIQIADASMSTTKQGFQGGVNTGYGGPVNPDTHVGYTFELQNVGETPIYNLTFNDPTIGVHVGYDYIDLNDTQYDAEGNLLYTFKDLYLIYWDAEGMHYHAPGTFDEETLKARLAEGLDPGEKLGVYGFKYKIQDTEWVESGEEEAFVNTVYTTATNTQNITGATKTLQGVADWKVVKMEVPYTPFHVYDWVHKAVSNDPADAESLVWTDPTANGIPVGNSVTVPFDKLKEFWTAQVNEGETTWDAVANATIVICTAAGNEADYNQNKNVSTDGKNITYTSKTTGKDTVFFKFKGIKEQYNDYVFSFEVYTYGAVDNVYVLDYGLAVELAGETFGFQNNDHLHLNENNRVMAATVTGMMGQVERTDDEGNTTLVWEDITIKDGTYGSFVWTAEDEDGNEINSLKYIPDEIMNGTDEVYAKFRLMEVDAEGEPTIYNSVEMVQKVTTAPASVVYYEENFPGITYVDSEGEGGNKWVHYETVDEDGNSLAGTEQSADQDMNYGNDDNYADDASGNWSEGSLVNPPDDEEITEQWEAPVINTTTLNLDNSDLNALQASGIEFLNDYLGLSGEASNGSMNVLEIKQTADVMFFDFVGTGFEIVSRTTDEKYAVIMVFVDKIVKDADGNIIEDKTTRVATQPVICESKGGDLYQVPIVSIKDLDRAEYRVTIRAAAAAGVDSRILYIDGVRVYGPLENGEALEYYNPAEYEAEIFEVKQLIQDGRAIYADASDTDGEVEFVTGSTMIEDVEEDGVLVAIEDVNDYMSLGPNNELYLDGNYATGVMAFFLTPIKNYPDSARTIQIGAHRKSDSFWESQGYVELVYGSEAQTVVDGDYGYTVGSGTEMYYTIHEENLLLDNGKYLVMIGTNGSENFGETLALTNLKIAGYDISFANTAVVAAADTGDVRSTPLVSEPYQVLKARMPAAEEPEVETIPVNENLNITSAALKANKVVSGKVATLTVKAGTEAQTIVVTDSAGNVVEATKLTRKVSGGVANFQFIWTVTGSRGAELTYTIRVYDANDLASVNTETVTVTIK